LWFPAQQPLQAVSIVAKAPAARRSSLAEEQGKVPEGARAGVPGEARAAALAKGLEGAPGEARTTDLGAVPAEARVAALVRVRARARAVANRAVVLAAQAAVLGEALEKVREVVLEAPAAAQVVGPAAQAEGREEAPALMVLATIPVVRPVRDPVAARAGRVVRHPAGLPPGPVVGDPVILPACLVVEVPRPVRRGREPTGPW
jgi:hypothetical protein